MKKPAIRLGTWGAALGMLTGLVELGIGAQIRPWIGDKENPLVLGIVTLLLSSLAFAAILFASKRAASTRNSQLIIFLGLLLPAAICFTTVGWLWYLPGSLLLAAAALLASEFWMTPRSRVSPATAGQAWRLMAGLGSLVVLLSVGLAIWQSSFGLFQAEIPVRADRLRVEVLPMDFVRRTAFTYGIGLVENIESGQERSIYLCLILGAALAFIASLVSSRLFSGIGGSVVLLGLLLFLAWLPGILAPTQLAPGYPILLKSMSCGWYLATAGLIMILSGVFWKRVK
jgi:hypothetical protein